MQARWRETRLGAGRQVSESNAMSDAPPQLLIKSLTLEEVGERLRAVGQPGYRAKQVMQWIYGKRVPSFAEMSDLPAGLRQQLGSEFAFSGLEPVRTLGSLD